MCSSGPRQDRFYLCLVEFLVPDEFAGQHLDQVPVLVNGIAGPRLQPVDNSNGASPAVWRFAQRQHLARACGRRRSQSMLGEKFDGRRRLRRDAGTAVSAQVARLPDADGFVDYDRQLPYAISAGPLRSGMPCFMKCAQFFRRAPSTPTGRRALEGPTFGGVSGKVHHNGRFEMAMTRAVSAVTLRPLL